MNCKILNIIEKIMLMTRITAALLFCGSEIVIPKALHARINSVGKIIKKLLLKFPVFFLPLPSHNLYTPYSATKLTMAK